MKTIRLTVSPKLDAPDVFFEHVVRAVKSPSHFGGYEYDAETGQLTVFERDDAELRAVLLQIANAQPAPSGVVKNLEQRIAVIEKELTDDDNDPATPGLLTSIKEFFKSATK